MVTSSRVGLTFFLDFWANRGMWRCQESVEVGGKAVKPAGTEFEVKMVLQRERGNAQNGNSRREITTPHQENLGKSFSQGEKPVQDAGN